MAYSTTKLTRQSSTLMLPAIAKLARKRFKQTWGLLFTTWLGMLAMLVLVCAVPLFSRVATSANLLDLARNAQGGANITFNVGSSAPTASQLQQNEQQIGQLTHSYLGPYLSAGDAQLAVKTPDLQVFEPQSTVADPQSGLAISAFNNAQTTRDVTLLQGRLPQAASDAVEIAVTQKTATAFHLHIGSLKQVRFPLTNTPVIWQLRVVGILAVKPAAGNIWQVPQFGPPLISNDPNQYDGVANPGDGLVIYNALASQQVILPKINRVQLNQPTLGMIALNYTPAQPQHAASGGGPQPTFSLSWSYAFDPTRVTVDNVSTLIQQYRNLQNQFYSSSQDNGGYSGPPIQSNFLAALDLYSTVGIALQIGITLLLILILGLALFTVSMLSAVLVERQTATIAVLRSRGATRRHIFGAFVLQGLGLGLATLLVAPVLALLLVAGIARVLISPQDLQALTAITSDPVLALLQIKWFALITVCIAFLALVLAVRKATRLDIVILRQEAARTTQKPFWRRVHLDLFVGFLVCLGYAFYVYLESLPAGVHQSLRYIVAPLAYIAAPAVLITLLLFFMRLFPLLLRLGLKLAARGRRAASVLAFAQMERMPRAVSRLILLLAIAVATSFYLLTFIATTQQRPVDTTAYQVGADFSGPVAVASDNASPLQTLEATYRAQTGVTAATLGYRADTQQTPHFNTIHVAAIDADTYAQTATWSPQYSTQALNDLMGQLAAHRADAEEHNVVYALVDPSMWQGLNLSPGEAFSLPVPGYGANGQMHFIALAEVNTIPGFNDLPSASFFGIGLMADYQSYATVYAKDNPGSSLQPNYVWLHTSDDASALAGIRHAWPTLMDRRALLESAQTNPLQINILGTLIATWISTASRLTNFAVLRALGMAPRQVATILRWEQGVVYLVALLLGLGLGFVLTVFVAPAFSLLDNIGATSVSYNSISEIVPIRTVIPQFPIGLVLAGVTLICLGGLFLMTLIATRPSLSQTLRLNED